MQLDDATYIVPMMAFKMQIDGEFQDVARYSAIRSNAISQKRLQDLAFKRKIEAIYDYVWQHDNYIACLEI